MGRAENDEWAATKDQLKKRRARRDLELRRIRESGVAAGARWPRGRDVGV